MSGFFLSLLCAVCGAFVVLEQQQRRLCYIFSSLKKYILAEAAAAAAPLSFPFLRSVCIAHIVYRRNFLLLLLLFSAVLMLPLFSLFHHTHTHFRCRRRRRAILLREKN